MKVIVDHPSHAAEPTNCSSIAHAFVRPDLITPSRLSGRQIVDFGSYGVIDHFVEQVLTDKHRSFVLSAEAFCYLRNRDERKSLNRVLDRLKCEVVPIVYFRNEADWRRSWESQLTKMTHTRVFQERHPGRLTILGDWYFDRRAVAEFWRSISPHTLFLDYDMEVAEHGSVVPSFLNAVGLPQSLNSDRYFLNRRSA